MITRRICGLWGIVHIMMKINHNGVIFDSYGVPHYGIRPVVSLPSNISVEHDEVNELWTVK